MILILMIIIVVMPMLPRQLCDSRPLNRAITAATCLFSVFIIIRRASNDLRNIEQLITFRYNNTHIIHTTSVIGTCRDLFATQPFGSRGVPATCVYIYIYIHISLSTYIYIYVERERHICSLSSSRCHTCSNPAPILSHPVSKQVSI